MIIFVVDYCIEYSNPLFQDIKVWYGVIRELKLTEFI